MTKGGAEPRNLAVFLGGSLAGIVFTATVSSIWTGRRDARRRARRAWANGDGGETRATGGGSSNSSSDTSINGGAGYGAGGGDSDDDDDDDDGEYNPKQPWMAVGRPCDYPYSKPTNEV